MDWYIDAFRNYANFKGRARRKAYWMFLLFHLIAAFLIGIIDATAGTFDEVSGLGFFGALYLLASFIPNLALTVRRLHDIGRSGWWILIAGLPLIGIIVLLIFSVLDSTPGENEYGPNPKGVAG